MNTAAKRISFLALAGTVLSNLFALKAIADGTFSPSTFRVTFYEIGFINPTTGEKFEILNSTSGAEIDFSNPGSANVLADNVRPPARGTYTHTYAITSNRYKLAGNDGTGCFISSGAQTIAINGSFMGYSSATTNAASAATSANPAVLWDNTFGLITNNDPNLPAGAFGPATPNIVASVNNNVASLTSYLTTASQPTNTNVPGARTTRERTLYLGSLPQAVTIDSSSGGNISFTISATNSGLLYGNCTAFRFNGAAIAFGMYVTTN
jgi:hypothetical protein